MMRRTALLLLLCLAACHAKPPPQPAPRHLRRINGQIGGTFKQLSDAGRFATVVPGDWTTDHFSAGGERLELGFKDSNHQDHIIELLIDEPRTGQADGRGRIFFYRFVRGSEGEPNAKALLAAAGLIDQATPPEALFSVEVEAEPSTPIVVAPPIVEVGDRSPMEAKTISKTTALAIAVGESLIVLLAILLGVLAPLRQRRGESQ